ncbi:MAG: MiaB/RimO family radical SAM methylthiotransferase [Coriobacteriia bacterium]|nr:MiaB/RimO family radical SAM methylthiotransferase [Coriobacteriia bacterium]
MNESSNKAYERTAGVRVAFVTHGCRVNQAESQCIADELAPLCAFEEQDDADVIVVNTCTVTAEADRKARKAIRHALSLPHSPEVIVTGCLSAIDPAGVRLLGRRVIVEPDKDLVAARVVDACAACVDGDHSLGRSALESPVRARVGIKVQDGCDSFCNYCIVPYARGLPRSVPAARVVDRVADLASKGIAEVVLTGVAIGRYCDGEKGLSDLLEAVGATGIPRVRLSSIEPCDIDERLLEVAAKTQAFCAHLHVPLQSGCDRVLQQMGRGYTAERFSRTLDRVREYFPGAAISTDVMAGFPGETDAEFEETMSFVESEGFSRLHVFRYSPRPGTPAASMADQVPADIRVARAAALRELGEKMSAWYAESQVGLVRELLVERVSPGECSGSLRAEGTTREFLRMDVDVGAGCLPGALLSAVVEGVTADCRVTGRVVL